MKAPILIGLRGRVSVLPEKWMHVTRLGFDCHGHPAVPGGRLRDAVLLSATFLIAMATGLGLAAPRIEVEFKGNCPSLLSDDSPGQRLALEQSGSLIFTNWQEVARVRNRLRPYEDVAAAGRTNGFYRLVAAPLQTEDDWSNQLDPAGGDLFTTNSGSGLANIRFVKFQFYLARPDRVLFQDSARWDTHYAFAVARFPDCAGMTVPEYDLQALYPGANQRMVVGSVLRAPDPLKHEVGIQIAGNEAFPINDAADWIAAVQRRLVLDAGWQSFYMPSATQRAAAEAGTNELAARGIALDSLVRWATKNAGYSTGWALGRLVFVPGTEINAALGDGRLGFGDILVTDWVPAELPVLAGYLSLEPATPSSHVALLARALALPFAYANTAGTRSQISALYGKEILLVVEETNNECRITMTDTTGLLTPEQRQAILDSKKGGALDIVPIASAGTISMVVDALTPADVRYVGGKAANFGFLRRSLPTNSPSPAIAFTFDLWDSYLSQTLPDGRTLRQKIAARLGAYTFPPNMTTVRDDLAAVRALFTGTADFNSAQRAQIVAALQAAGFGGRMIRFRSSTNVEDSDVFNGAGLYDSYSGCLEDDLDGDIWGPCRCDPTEPEERGVFRAIRKVYASFYNENAFLERLRHGVAETSVGMAILVHYSSPDAEEMANGVALLAIEKTGGVRRARANIATQLGADSVTNPDATKRPETVVTSYVGTDTADAVLTRTVASSLTTNGAPVMTWEVDYRTLLDQIDTATLAYEAYYTNKTSFELDFEFKRMAPGNVGLKQIRAVPHPVQVPPPVITNTFSATNDYMVVNLSGGPTATSYPVTYLPAVPEGGWTDEYKTTKLVLRRIPAGGFVMGSPGDEYRRSFDELQHAVVHSHDVFVGVFEVTQKQWERVMGNWPSFFTNATCRDSRPVEQVSYDDIRGINAGANWPNYNTVDADSFMGKLRARTGRSFDLPTESQWEYAGRAGVGTSLNSGENIANLYQDDNLAVVARYWYTGGSNWNERVDTSGGTAKVGSYLPNAWGLYDIHGNVWEWCLDIYDGYPAGPVWDPPGGAKIEEWPWDVRVWRGGAWDCGSEWYGAPSCRMACRNSRESTHLFLNLGFRVAAPP